jgi:hypothetical protein
MIDRGICEEERVALACLVGVVLGLIAFGIFIA